MNAKRRDIIVARGTGQALAGPASARLSQALYRTMLRIRRAQEGLIREYHPADEMRCPVHFCVGQEAIPAGVCLNLSEADYVFSHHRSHGYFLAKGGSMRSLFAELYGKATGSNGGKAGSQELSDISANFYSGTILSGMVPIAAGAALAVQMRGDRRVVVAVFGDGGADEGVVYETMNFAALKRLPLVFVCENNSYSTYSHQRARQPLDNIAGRARSFGILARRLYGNDAVGVYHAARRAIGRARRGQGPSFLELDTYRYCGHVGPEDDDHLQYRPREELEAWRARCPIATLGELLLQRGILTREGVATIEREVAQEIEDAFVFAKSSPFPEPEALMRDVFGGASVAHAVAEAEFPSRMFDFHQSEALPRPY